MAARARADGQSVSRTRIVLGLVGVVIALNVGVQLVRAAYPAPGGPASSAYATAGDGVAAYAALLERTGHAVLRSRSRPRELALDPGTSTIVLLDGGLVDAKDAAALRSFVEGGGRLVVGGAGYGWLGKLVEPAPDWSPETSGRIRMLAPSAAFARVRRIDGLEEGRWKQAGASLPLLGDAEGSLLTVMRLGRGEAYLLADTAPLHNDALARGDNATLGAALAGPAFRRVAFLERYHGYGAASGLAAIPRRWLVTLSGMLVAALAFMLARGRRLGPPEETERELAPPRALYVESLGALLARTRRRDGATEPLRARAQSHGERLGLSAAERALLAGEPSTACQLLELGRLAADIERRATGTAR